MTVKFNAERIAYETQILQLQQRVVDLESQVDLITVENERFSKLSVTRLEEVEDLRRTSNSLKASQHLEVSQLRAQIETFKASSHVKLHILHDFLTLYRMLSNLLLSTVLKRPLTKAKLSNLSKSTRTIELNLISFMN